MNVIIYRWNLQEMSNKRYPFMILISVNQLQFISVTTARYKNLYNLQLPHNFQNLTYNYYALKKRRIRF